MFRDNLASSGEHGSRHEKACKCNWSFCNSVVFCKLIHQLLHEIVVVSTSEIMIHVSRVIDFVELFNGSSDLVLHAFSRVEWTIDIYCSCKHSNIWRFDCRKIEFWCLSHTSFNVVWGILLESSLESIEFPVPKILDRHGLVAHVSKFLLSLTISWV